MQISSVQIDAIINFAISSYTFWRVKEKKKHYMPEKLKCNTIQTNYLLIIFFYCCRWQKDRHVCLITFFIFWN